MKEKIRLILAGAAFVAIFQQPAGLLFAQATPGGRFQKGTREIGMGLGYGVEIDGGVQTLSVLPRWGYFLKATAGQGILRGALETVVEPLVGLHTTPSRAAEVGATFRVVYHFELSGPFVPFLDVGLGALYEDLRGKDLGSQFLFNSGAGVGIEYFLGKNRTIWLGYRFRHVSNAGTARKNDGLSSNFVVLGLSFFRSPDSQTP
jgi:hypothetical protein